MIKMKISITLLQKYFQTRKEAIMKIRRKTGHYSKEEI